jgi:hypothetical protein
MTRTRSLIRVFRKIARDESTPLPEPASRSIKAWFRFGTDIHASSRFIENDDFGSRSTIEPKLFSLSRRLKRRLPVFIPDAKSRLNVDADPLFTLRN